MLRRKTAGLMGLVLVACAALAIGLASIGQAARAGAQATKVVKVYTALEQARVLDLGQHGFSVGDEDVFSDNVFTKRNGSKVGIDGGVCTVIRVSNPATPSGTDQCVITFVLRGSQITTQDLQPSGQFTGTATGAITGGTGTYRQARGVYSVQFHGPTSATVTFSLQ